MLLTFDFEEWEGSYNFYEADLLTKTERVISLLLDYDLPATFFLDAYTCLKYPESVELLTEGKCELALHSDYHPGVPVVIQDNRKSQLMSFPDFRQDSATQILRIKRGISMIREIIPDFEPSGFRAPNLKWNEELYVSLSKLGFAYDSSQRTDSFHPFMEQNVTVIPVNCGDFDSGCYQMRSQYVFFVWKNNLERALRIGSETGFSHFVILAHPSVSGKSRYIGMLKAILKYLMCLDVRVLTCRDFVRLHRSRLTGDHHEPRYSQ